MHYKNGRPAKAGDKILALNYDGKPLAVGYLVDPQAGSTSCNGTLLTAGGGLCVTIGECLLVDDVKVEAAPYPPAVPVGTPPSEPANPS